MQYAFMSGDRHTGKTLPQDAGSTVLESNMPMSLHARRSALRALRMLLLLASSCANSPHFSPRCAAVTFAAAVVGDIEAGMSLNVQQQLPPGAWQQVREGGCLLGRGAHLVVDPGTSVEETLADSRSMGRRLCDWLSDMLEHHLSRGAKLGHRGRHHRKSSKTSPKSTFPAALHVTLTHLDLEDFEEDGDLPGHAPLPWAQLTFTYYSNRSDEAIPFCGYSGTCSKPAPVHVLLTPEIGRELQQEAAAHDAQETLSSRSSPRSSEAAPEGELSADSLIAFQMLPVRNFHWLDPECICLDGRLAAHDYGLCQWALQQRKHFPTASATLLFKSVSLFRGKYARVTGKLQLENPAYRPHKDITFNVKPMHSRAVLTRNHYYDRG